MSYESRALRPLTGNVALVDGPLNGLWVPRAAWDVDPHAGYVATGRLATRPEPPFVAEIWRWAE